MRKQSARKNNCAINAYRWQLDWFELVIKDAYTCVFRVIVKSGLIKNEAEAGQFKEMN